MANEVNNPFPLFLDIDGSPLEDGYIYIGEPELDPETNTKQVYWDSALSEPITQPIRTKSGYPVNGTIPARVYIDGAYSILIQNKREADITAYVDAFIAGSEASGITIIDAGEYYTSDSVEGALQEAGASIEANSSDISTLQSDKLAKSDPAVDAEVQTLTLNSTGTPAAGMVRFNADDEQFEGSTDGINWAPLGSGLDAQGYNYDNKSMEVSIAGYNTYKDTAQDTPEDGTGGTPVAVAVSEETTDPIIGTRSLKLSKSAVDGQGEGVGYDFTLDKGVLGRTVEIPFKYRTTTNYADGDLGCYIYDVDNDLLYYPSVVDIPASSNGEILDFFATFLPSANGGNNFRLIFHVQTTNALAWDVDIDDIQVGKKQTVIGDGHEVLDTGWINFDNAFNSINYTLFEDIDSLSDYSVSIFYRDAGIEYNVSAGQAENNTNPSTDRFIAVRKDSSVLTTVKLVTGASGFYRLGLTGALSAVDNLDTGDLRVVMTKIVKNINLASDFTEYASNSSQTDADDTTSFVYGPGGSEGVIGNTALTASRLKRVEFKKPIQPTDKITIELYDPTTGVWIEGDIVPSTALILNHFAYQTRTGGIAYQFVDKYRLDIRFYISPSGGATDWDEAQFSGVRWRVRKVSNGNMAEVPRMVRAEYWGIEVFGDVTYPIDFPTKVEDTHNAVSGAGTNAWKFTAPIDGVYQITGSGRDAGATTYTTTIYKDGVADKRIGTSNLGIVQAYNFAGSIRLSAGESIDVRNNQSFTYSAGGNAFWITIERIGN